MLAIIGIHSNQIAVGQEGEVMIQGGCVKRAEEQLAVIFRCTPDILHAAELRAVGEGMQRFGKVIPLLPIKILIW